ncbi:MAG: prepilin-type N-terminal cleavage/methylation domain-containing protein [Planctomycetes bacterium]|nr:prepilin-type N-terminal cleavage/methylation domain-containing protein [Planctomycetota bacterium]
MSGFCSVQGACHSRCGCARAGFTLVELIVSVSVIAVLLALLLPVLGSARVAVNSSICLSNMRQMGLAVTAYTQDYKGIFPQPGYDEDIRARGYEGLGSGHPMNQAAAGSAIWFNAVDDYLNKNRLNYQGSGASAVGNRHYEKYKQDPVWERLPADGQLSAMATTYDCKQSNNRTIKMNYRFGKLLNDPTDEILVYWIRETRIFQTSGTVLLGDGRAQDLYPMDAPAGGTASHFHLLEATIGLRHNGGANIVFVDGSGRHETQRYKLSVTGANPSGYAQWYRDPDVDQKLTWRILRPGDDPHPD